MISELQVPMTLLILIVLLTVVAFISWWATKCLIKVLLKHQIVDTPNERSMHLGSVPRGGGIVIVACLVLALIVVGLVSQRYQVEQFGANAEFKVNKMHKMYYDGDGKYLQPVMAYETTVMVTLSEGKINEIPYLSIVAALKSPPEAIELTKVDPEANRMLNKIKQDQGKPNPKQDGD